MQNFRFRSLFLSRPKALVLGISVTFAALAIFSAHNALSEINGIIGQSKIGCTGGGCHDAGASPTTVVTVATTATEFVVGQSYMFTFTVKNPTQSGAGCDISVQRGKLAASGTGIRLLGKELTHTAPKVFAGDSAVFNFKYTAPATAGIDNIYAAGNAVNLDGNNTGDKWNTTVFPITVVSTSGVSSAAQQSLDLRMSPNPVENALHIGMSTNSIATVSILDASGRRISSEKMLLDGAATLDVRNLTNGVYWLEAETSNGHFSNKFVVQH